jgi:rsbT co-antagonist protein RsbR
MRTVNTTATIPVSLFEQVLEQLPTPVMAVNTAQEIVFLNAAGRSLLGESWEDIVGKPCSQKMCTLHCGTPECCMVKAMADGGMHSARNEGSIRGQHIPIEYYAAPLKDADGTIIGGLEYILDITERVRHEQRLTEQARTIREISTPAIKLWDGIIVLPVVGLVDSMRSQQIMESMLMKIAAESCKVAVLDIQGVPTVDTAVANHFIKIVKAIKLMGCEAIISGISPMVAQTIVGLGVDMGVRTIGNLADALAEAFALLKIEVRSNRLK